MADLIQKFRRSIPESHHKSLDTRIQWLWGQRFGAVQSIWRDSKDVLDHTAATLVLQAVMAQDLNSIELLFQRLEGGAVVDDKLAEQNLRV